MEWVHCIYDSSRSDNVYPTAVIALRAGRLQSRNETLTKGVDDRIAAIMADQNLSEDERAIIEEISEYVRALPDKYRNVSAPSVPDAPDDEQK